MIKLKNRFWLCLCLGLFSASALADFKVFQEALNATQTEKAKLLLVQETEPEVANWGVIDQGRFHHQKGLVLEINDQIEAAKQAFTQAIEIYEKDGTPNEHWVSSLFDRSYMDYLLTNDPKVYCPDRKAAVAVARKLGEAKALARALVRLAFCYQEGVEGFKIGLQVLDEAARIAQENQLAGSMTGMIHNATANLYRSKNIHDKAYEYYAKAYQAWALQGLKEDVQDMFNMLHNMVAESIKTGAWEQADGHVNQLFQMAEEHPDFRDFTFFAFYNQAQVTYAQNQFLPAIESIEMAQELADTTPETYFVKVLKGLRVVAYFRLGEFNTAAEYVAEAKQEIGDQASLQELLTKLQVVEAHQAGEYGQALSHLWSLLDQAAQSKHEFVKNAVALESVTFDQKIIPFQQQALADQLTIQQLELEKQTKQSQINQLELDKQIKENKINQLILTLISIGLLGLLLAFWLVYRSRHKYLDLSRTDPLTKIANRRHIMALGHQALKRSQEQKQAFYLAIIDIDNFKQINDQYGHVMGDQVIKAVVQVLRQHAEGGPLLGRIGGEEFVLMGPNSSFDVFSQLLDAARTHVAGLQIAMSEQTVGVTISGGYVGASSSADTLEGLMSLADDALYQAKAAGKNQMVLASRD
ncbi:tetratricopeptide repeat-containing diguanylate cyclase [Marinicella meishanensis]|uniref:tetratricopeptide repeat-containing diguanylate cyclase n=1 Tax=Marinicella meishanensis TaxID=2873263 RepID=UPI001CBC33AD|nr:GGDEF domain-containing protein [Marinicella sp. NBU2979]